MDAQQKQHIIDLPKVVAGGVATPVGALLTSRFGVAGTMIGLAVSAVTVTVISDTLKVYLARVPGAVTSIPGGLRKKSFWGRLLGRVRLPFSKLASLPAARRRSLLIRSLIGGVIMFVIGLVIVTGVELGVGKNLSCWVWDDCYTESSSTGGENATDAGSLPSIFIAGNSIRASASQVSSPAPQQQPAPPVAPAPPVSSSASGNGSQPPVSEQPSVSQQQPSAPASEQQPSEYPQRVESQQQSEYRQQGQYQQSSQTSSQEGQPQSNPSSTETQQPSDSQQQSQTPPASPPS